MIKMEIRSVEEIIAEIKLKYDSNPYNWKMLRGRDRAGHYDTYVMNEKTLWQMKTEFRNPYQPTGVGVRVKDPPIEEVEFLMEKGAALPFSEVYPQTQSNPIFAMGVGRFSPPAANTLKGIISSRQEELEKNLSESLDKLLHREGICKDYL